MTCAKGKVAPGDVTKLRLFADSGGYCQNPTCLAELFRDIDDRAIHIAEIAHVISAADKGPRADPTTTPEQRGTYENLILLCPVCHTTIDKADDKFPEKMIFEWKKRHKQRIADQFGLRQLESREEVRKALSPLLHENRTIFEGYGPMTSERFNPESSLPRQWLRKVRTRILPNNRKVLAICDANRTLLRGNEVETVELFRQHVEDFEAKHVGESPDNGRQFPAGMNDIFM